LRLRKSDGWHLAAPLLVSIVLATTLHLSSHGVQPSAMAKPFLDRLNDVLNMVILLQLIAYAALVLRRLTKYQLKLKGVFSNAANLIELKWFRLLVLMIALTLLVEIAAQLLYFTQEIPDIFYLVNNVLRALLVWSFAVWGLRQQPELMIELSKTKARNEPSAGKYKNSAMSKVKLTEVAAKIRLVLESQKLYRDPNMSLRLLAEEVQVLPNYVSQALNTEIDETFFDYINQLRVQDAMQRLVSSDETVTRIAAEVGFNSRSSFYTAFRKTAGKTPAAYREEASPR